MDMTTLFENVGRAIDVVGVAVIVVGASAATIIFAVELIGRGPFEAAYRNYRRGLGRAILVGLELLVAADIIRTVAVSPTIERALSLGIIVLIRTVLSFSLQVEIDGRWPWQRAAATAAAAPKAAS